MTDKPFMTEKEVRNIVDERLMHLGFDPNNPEEVRDRISWLRAKKKLHDNIVMWTARTIVVTVIGAALLVIWEGIKAYLRKSGD